MAKRIYTVGGNTANGNSLIANGGMVCFKNYPCNYGYIKKIWRPKYKDEEEIFKVCHLAFSFVGYIEKKSNSYLEDFTANAGSNNYNLFAEHARKATGCGVYANGVSWCDIFEDDMFIRAFGVKRAKELLYDWSAYTPTSNAYLRLAGAKEIKDFSKANAGDIIFFDKGKGICHVEICVNGISNYPYDFPQLPEKGYFEKGDISDEVMKLKKFLNWWNPTYDFNEKSNSVGEKCISAFKDFKIEYNIGSPNNGRFGKNCLSVAKTIVK